VTHIIRAACVVSLALQGVCALSASAQTRATGQRHRFEASIGGLWLGGATLGSNQADLRANRVPPGSFRLFTTDTRAAGTGGFDARVSYWLTRSLAVEGGFVRVTPELRTRISADAEGAAALTVAERIDQYFVDAGALWLLEKFRFRARTVPFVSGGAGYLRQLHEGRTLVETGQVYHAGGGLRHLIRSDMGWIRAVGARFDARVYVLVDGVQFEERPRTHGAVSASMFFTF
jgi:hypothetical protein